MNVYQNGGFKLPSATGRVWYEADINYGAVSNAKKRI